MKTKLIVILIAVTFLAGCGKKDEPKNEMNTKTQKEGNVQESKKPDNTTAISNVSKLLSVEKSKGSKTAPVFTWDENGKSVSLKDNQDKIVLINFWATWCKPCVAEMPDLSAISEELSGKDFKMIGVSIDKTADINKVSDFLKARPVSYTIVYGNDDISNAFGEADGKPIEGIPTTYIIDKKGKIVETIVGSRSKEDFMKLIKKHLK